MKKELIYLSALDSVRKTKPEILLGQQKMYDAIVQCGYCVVISFNQLTDSRSFLGPINSERSESIMDFYIELFNNESLKISRFTPPDGKPTVRTAAQYVLNSLENAINASATSNAYIFSSLPIAKGNVSALNIVYDSLKYCDLDLLNTLPGVSGPDRSYIKRYVKWILELSIHPSYYIDEKKETYLKLADYLDAIIQLTDYSLFAESAPNDFPYAQTLLRSAEPQDKTKRCARSNWLNNLNSLQTSNVCALLLAKDIVNLCYNLSVEASINGINKVYHTDISNYIRDFWQIKQQMQPASQPEKKDVITIALQEFPDWAFSTRVTNESYKIIAKTKGSHNDRQFNWRKICKSGQRVKLAKALSFYLIFLIIELVTGTLERTIDWISNAWFHSLLAHPLVKSVLYSVIVTTALSFFSSYISKKADLPDITDVFQNIKEFGSDYPKLPRSNTWHNKEDQ